MSLSSATVSVSHVQYGYRGGLVSDDRRWVVGPSNSGAVGFTIVGRELRLDLGSDRLVSSSPDSSLVSDLKLKKDFSALSAALINFFFSF